jgi:quercetin dioxygenase-like cupin family protein
LGIETVFRHTVEREFGWHDSPNLIRFLKLHSSAGMGFHVFSIIKQESYSSARRMCGAHRTTAFCGDVIVSALYSQIPNLTESIELPANGTLSRAIYQDDRLKAVLFGFSAGQELSEHTASTPAVMHFLKGEATITLGDDVFEVTAGGWVHMAAGLRHSIRTHTPVVMLLLLLK